MPDNGGKPDRIDIRCTNQLKDDLKKLAKKDDRRVSDYARLVLIAHVENNPIDESDKG